MKNSPLETFDWNKMYQQARETSCSRNKNSESWDNRAAGFARRTSDSLYAKEFIRLMNPNQEISVLDMGCGPGTISLPLAKQVRRITAVDFSQNMLNILNSKKSQQNLKNITTQNCSWEDDLEGTLKKHDVAIASRSLAVDDLKGALTKLCSCARSRVCVTDRVGSGPHDPKAFAAVKRTLPTRPDYIFTVNILYQMGHFANINFIPLEKDLIFNTFAEALDSYMWMFQDLSKKESIRLETYVRSRCTETDTSKILLRREHVPVWAFIHWSLDK